MSDQAEIPAEPQVILEESTRAIQLSEARRRELAAQVNHEAATPLTILSRALEAGQSVEILEKLMSMQERHQASQARKAFDAAISAAKAEISVIIKDRSVDYTPQGKPRVNYRYEDLASIAREVNPKLAAHGLSYRFRTEQPREGWIRVTCIVAHRDGHSEETFLEGPPDIGAGKNALQAIESTVTYLQRYTLKAALGLAAGHDDDGRQGQPSHGRELTGFTPAEPDPPKPQPSLTRAQAEDAVARRMEEDEIAESTLDKWVASVTKGKVERWQDLPDSHMIALAGDEKWGQFIDTLPKHEES
jgi:hypothetical protein